MSKQRISFEVDIATLAALEKCAAEDGSDVGSLLRQAVNRDLHRRNRAKKAVRPDERLVAPLRALLAEDLAYATGWQDLQRRLLTKGYRLQESGGGLILVRSTTGERIVKASDLGYSHARLMQRFQTPFPGLRKRFAQVRHP